MTRAEIADELERWLQGWDEADAIVRKKIKGPRPEFDSALRERERHQQHLFSRLLRHRATILAALRAAPGDEP